MNIVKMEKQTDPLEEINFEKNIFFQIFLMKNQNTYDVKIQFEKFFTKKSSNFSEEPI